MGIQKDVKTAWRDSKKFAKKHPLVAVLIGGTGTVVLLSTFLETYITTKMVEQGFE